MKYVNKIIEDLPFLQEAEKQRKLAIDRDRIRFLRLLKTGEAKSQAAAGKYIGISERQAQRLWKIYQQQGFNALMSQPLRRGWGKLSSTQISKLRTYLLQDQAQTLSHIQDWLSTTWRINYTVGGVSSLCKRLKIKRKTGRPVNVRQEPDAVEGFKKNGQPYVPLTKTSK